MDDLEQIVIPGGETASGTPFTSTEDVPPRSEASTRGDSAHSELMANSRSYRELRERFAGKAYKVVKYGLYFWGCLCFIYIIGNACGKPVIHDDVMIAVTTATTLNLFAAFLGVIKGLFPSSGSSDS